MRESDHMKIRIKFPNINLAVKAHESITLNQGDCIKVKIGDKISMYGIVKSGLYSVKPNLYAVDVEEVDDVDESRIKEVFTI